MPLLTKAASPASLESSGSSNLIDQSRPKSGTDCSGSNLFSVFDAFCSSVLITHYITTRYSVPHLSNYFFMNNAG